MQSTHATQINYDLTNTLNRHYFISQSIIWPALNSWIKYSNHQTSAVMKKFSSLLQKDKITMCKGINQSNTRWMGKISSFPIQEKSLNKHYFPKHFLNPVIKYRWNNSGCSLKVYFYGYYEIYKNSQFKYGVIFPIDCMASYFL